MKKINKGFTLVELLVVMAILGVLVTLIGTAFRTAQARGRDVQRKSDLKQIANALELFFNDYGFYPPGDVLMQKYLLEKIFAIGVLVNLLMCI